MTINQADLPLFKKLHIKNVLDLALILPKKMENLMLSKAPSEDICTEEVMITRVNSYSGKMLGAVWCKNWGFEASFIFFHPSKWHFGVFKVGKECIFHAKMNLYNGAWQFSNPKIIAKAGNITPKYQITGIKDESIARIIKTYLTREALLDSTLDERRVELVLKLHAYDSQSYEMIKHLQDFERDLKFIEIYNFLRRLRSKKQPPKSYEIELYDISTWLESLPFAPTSDQLHAINDIKGDLRSRDAKRRIIMGDVGCGKTLVLLAAALLVYPKQAVLMAPTSILAQQIYDEAVRLLPKFVQIELLTGGKKPKDITNRLNSAHLIIGTHALIHLESTNAVLVMVDEQHRFGSNQRQKINDLARQNELAPHFVQFSATPIPRTLSMIQSELVNFSFIRQMPYKKDITSFCVQDKDFPEMLKRINAEIAAKHQVAIIYPLVEERENGSKYLPLKSAENYWKSRYDGVYSTYGKDKNKEAVLLEFREKGQIILATTLMEVGISLPRLSTIIIVGAEKLGMATLHQLRGRVGRVGLPSFCYFYTKQELMPQRLIELSKTLDGFVVAELDLKNRMSGDLIDGFMQHGNKFSFFDFATDEDILREAKGKLNLAGGV